MPKGVKKENLPSKTCVVCERPFTWRKKWERCWDEVQCCSKRCNNDRKKSNRIASGAAAAAGGSGDEQDDRMSSASSMSGAEEEVSVVDDPKAARRAAKRAAKAEKRAKREGTVAGHGQKACDMCDRSVDLLIRCQVDHTPDWKMVCGKCWKTPEVAGGVVDGDGSNPHYRYGGLWKNLHAAQA